MNTKKFKPTIVKCLNKFNIDIVSYYNDLNKYGYRHIKIFAREKLNKKDEKLFEDMLKTEFDEQDLFVVFIYDRNIYITFNRKG